MKTACGLLFAALLFLAPEATAATYYVDGSHPRASDANAGTETAPWKSLQHAAATLVAGDTAWVRRGTYAERVVVSTSGAAGGEIVLAAYPGETVTIDGSGIEVPEYSGLLELLGVSYVRVRGFTVTNAGPHPTSTGIQVEDCSHVTVERNHVSNTASSGILVWTSSDVVVDGNEVDSAMSLGAASRNECISVGRSTRFEIRNNEVHDNQQVRGEGICLKDGSTFGSAHHNHVHHVPSVGIYVDAWTEHTHDIDVYANRVHHVGGDGIACASEQGGLLEHIRVFNNVVYSNLSLGFDLSGCCMERHPMADIAVVNNSFWNNGVSWGGGLGVAHDQWTGLVIRNNAAFGNLSFDMDAEDVDLSAAAIDHNLVGPLRDYPGEFCGAACQLGDPRWANPAAGDFHLTAGSKAIDTGSAAGAPPLDIDSHPRPSGAGFDIGALEYPAAPPKRRSVRRMDAGGGEADDASSPCTGLQLPFVTDRLTREVPPFTEPAARTWYRDPTFGSCVVRVTDRTRDLSPDDPSGGLKNEYSRVQSFNAGESRILVRGTAATWYLYDAGTLLPVGQLPVDTDPRWDPADPNVLYFVNGTSLMRLDVRTQEPALLHDFTADFPGQALTFVWTRYEGSPSRDGTLWGLKADDQEYQTVALLIYDQSQDRVVARRDLRGVPGAGAIDNVTISPLGTYFVADFGDDYCERGRLGSDDAPCGLMVYDRNLQNGRGLLRIAGHLDLALDAAGREVAVYQDIDTDNLSMLDLATGVVTELLPLDFSQHAFGLHVSGRALGRPGWVVVSTHDAERESFTWMDKEVFLVELARDGRIVRLAHHQSRVDPAQEHDYWAEPQASTNRDLTRVVFTTNGGRSGSEAVEMYMIELPADWPARLDGGGARGRRRAVAH